MVITNIKYEQVFGNLTVLGLSLVRRSGPKQKPIYVCKCQCNKTVEVSEYDLISGHVKSCGCIHKKYDEICDLFEKLVEKGFIDRDFFYTIKGNGYFLEIVDRYRKDNISS